MTTIPTGVLLGMGLLVVAGLAVLAMAYYSYKHGDHQH